MARTGPSDLPRGFFAEWVTAVLGGLENLATRYASAAATTVFWCQSVKEIRTNVQANIRCESPILRGGWRAESRPFLQLGALCVLLQFGKDQPAGSGLESA